jgi:hypothetical protein
MQNLKKSILAWCLLLGLPMSSAQADDVKVHAPNAYLEDEVLAQLDGFQKSDPTLSWTSTRGRHVQITRRNAQAFHVVTDFHFRGNVTVPGAVLPFDDDIHLEFDVGAKCDGADYRIDTSNVTAVGASFGALPPDRVTAIRNRLENVFDSLPGKLDTAILEATTAFGTPSETICKSVAVSTAAALDLAFDVGDCRDGQKRVSACRTGMVGKGITRTCVDRRWKITSYDCEVASGNSGGSNGGPIGNGGNSGREEP